MSLTPSAVARVTPPIGTLWDVARNRDITTGAGKLAAQDVSLTTDRVGVWRQWTMVAGWPVDHGTVANQAAMLALHTFSADAETTPEPRYIAPGDSVLRTDDPGWRWYCLRGHGTQLSDWERRPLAGALAGLSVSGHTHALVSLTEVVTALSGKQAASANLDTLAGVASSAAGRNLLTVATPAGPQLVQVNADGSISLVAASSGGGGAADWEPVEVVEVTTAVAGVTLPSTGAFMSGYEYRVRFTGWTAAGSGDERDLRVDVGGGIITTTSYERHTVIESAGESATTYTYGASVSSVLSMAATGAASAVTGEVVFTPSDQAGGKAVFASATRYADASGRATLSRSTGALSSPTTSAIQRVYLFTYGFDSTGGRFSLSRRAL